MKEYLIKFVLDEEDITGEFESRFCAFDNALTISRRLGTKVEIYQKEALIKTFFGHKLTAPADSDWGRTEQFIIDSNYSPTHVSWESYVACMLLHWEGEVENEGETEDNTPLDNWLSLLHENYRMEDFDYE